MDRIRVSEALDTGSIPVGRTSQLKKTESTPDAPVAANLIRLAFLKLGESEQHKRQNSLDHLPQAPVAP